MYSYGDIVYVNNVRLVFIAELPESNKSVVGHCDFSGAWDVPSVAIESEHKFKKKKEHQYKIETIQHSMWCLKDEYNRLKAKLDELQKKES